MLGYFRKKEFELMVNIDVRSKQTVRREEEYDDSEESNDSDDTLNINRIQTIRMVRQVLAYKEGDKVVDINVVGFKIKLYTDTGSLYTIIPQELYRLYMGEILRTGTQLRTWDPGINWT